MDILDSVQSSLNTKSNLLLQASPGAGKTTIVPLLLSSLTSSPSSANAKPKNIILVEPRRVATRSAAQRMSSIINQPIGQTIGYVIRGETKTSSKTQITVMTDGVLLNKLRDDPELNGVDVVILDEFHERGVGSDTVLALCREVQLNFRPDDLNIVVMSATLLGDDDDNDNDDNNNHNNQNDGKDRKEESTGSKLVRVLGGRQNCDILESEGRQYPITFQHSRRGNPPHGLLLNDSKKLVQTMADAIEEGLQMAPSKGDILAFLPGAKEIKKVVRELKSRRLDNVDILPLYGALPKQEQDYAIYQPSKSSTNLSRRRIIVSSPIAEASLTIEGVTCVVDSGLRREPRFDVETGLPRLVTVPCSKDSAIQRAGRAGRTQDGLCIRIFNEAEYGQFNMHALPEICSTDLVPTTLFLSDWGCSSVKDIMQDMPFIDPPPEDGIKKAYQMLIDLEAIEPIHSSDKDMRYRISPHGQKLVKIPTHPRFASAIVKAKEESMESRVAAVVSVAILEEEIGGGRKREINLSKEVRHVLKQTETSITGKKVIQFASRIGPEARHAVVKAFNDQILASEVIQTVGRALLPGFIDLIAQRKGDASYSSSTYMLSLGRSSRLDGIQDAGDYIVVIDTSSGDDGISRIRSYVPIDVDYLHLVAKERDEFYSVASRGHEVRARRVVQVGSLELSSSPIQIPSSEVITQVLLDTIASLGGVSKALIQNQSKKSKDSIEELRNRVRLATKISTDQNWPECFAALDAVEDMTSTQIEEDLLLSLIEPWLSAAGSLKNVNIYNIFLSELSPEQSLHLEKFYPTKIEAPDNSNIPLSYTGEIPTASAKLQQFFGSTISPFVGRPGNSTPVSLTLLSPGGKPLAQTIDLPFFWKETYPSVRSEMRGRYPKHPWPEDPMDAAPTRLSKKQLAAQTAQDSQKVDKRKQRSKQRKRK
jgi:ATP-dependent helicase HrpB